MNIFNPGSLNILVHCDGNILFKRELWVNTFHVNLRVADTTHWMLLEHVNSSSRYVLTSELGLTITLAYFVKYM
jgi:hypothetical protein